MSLQPLRIPLVLDPDDEGFSLSMPGACHGNSDGYSPSGDFESISTSEADETLVFVDAQEEPLTFVARPEIMPGGFADEYLGEMPGEEGSEGSLWGDDSEGSLWGESCDDESTLVGDMTDQEDEDDDQDGGFGGFINVASPNSRADIITSAGGKPTLPGVTPSQTTGSVNASDATPAQPAIAPGNNPTTAAAEPKSAQPGQPTPVHRTVPSSTSTHRRTPAQSFPHSPLDPYPTRLRHDLTPDQRRIFSKLLTEFRARQAASFCEAQTRLAELEIACSAQMGNDARDIVAKIMERSQALMVEGWFCGGARLVWLWGVEIPVGAVIFCVQAGWAVTELWWAWRGEEYRRWEEVYRFEKLVGPFLADGWEGWA